MGWTTIRGVSTKKDLINDICYGYSAEHKFIKKSLVGNHLWTIWERNEERYICLYLLRKDGPSWSYKDITESVHPYYYDCPLSFLDEVPVANKTWREHVTDYHCKKRKNVQLQKKIDIGRVVKLKNSKPSVFRIMQLKPLLGVDVQTGLSYKIVKSRIIEVE